MALLDRIKQLHDAWAIRVTVLFSFALHVVLILFASIRRSKATGFWRSILWLANQLVDWAATYVLGNLSLGSTSQQQQLVAFWAPFLLMHLGRPDNISAYSLEDDKLSGRQLVEVFSQFIGAFFVLFKHIPFGRGGTLFPAAWIMFVVGFVKYVERTLALRRGDFGSIRSSGEKQKPRSFSADPFGDRELDDEQALLVAHRMFSISKGAFADYSIVPDPLKRPDDRDRQSFPHSSKAGSFSADPCGDRKRPDRIPHVWKDMWKVVEMELSLMYDILYTKAAIVHTWHGYLLRFVSPPLTALAFLLFRLYNKASQRRVDIIITYILLVATFLVDLRWLVGALGSTWTYAFLNEMASTRWCWLHHKLLCSGRWHQLRRVVVSPHRLLGKEPASYRKWSGTIGQYNLLHEYTHDTASLLRTLAKKIGLEDWLSQDSWMEYEYSRGLDISKKKLKELLFEEIRKMLKKAYHVKVECRAEEPKEEEPKEEEGEPKGVKIKKFKKEKPDEAARRRRRLDEALDFTPELGEDILVMHIATDVFLWCSDQNAAPSTCVKKAIKSLSDYMMFLVAVRPDMVPGLKLSSLHKTTRDALKLIGTSCPSSKTSEKKLACILRNKEQQPTERPSTRGKKNRSRLYDWSIILSDGARLANVLLGLLKDEPPETADCKALEASEEALEACAEALEAYEEALEETARIFNIKIEKLQDGEYIQNEQELLEDILRGWVRMLIYVSVRCSRDSHAKQLSRGGELTTIVWILAEHASILGIPVCESDEKYCSSSSLSMFGCL